MEIYQGLELLCGAYFVPFTVPNLQQHQFAKLWELLLKWYEAYKDDMFVCARVLHNTDECDKATQNSVIRAPLMK